MDRQILVFNLFGMRYSSVVIPVGIVKMIERTFIITDTECTTFAPATIAPVVNPNVKRNPNPKPYSPNLNPYPTPN